MNDRDLPNPAPESSAPPPGPNRRDLLSGLALGAVGALGLAALVGPSGVALSPLFKAPSETAPSGWLRVDGVTRFPIGGAPQRIVLRRDVRDGWLLRRGEILGAVLVERPAADRFQVLSSVCPHLGCTVVWGADRGQWICPCHKSAFARDGAIVPAESGPPNPSPRGLDPLEWRVAGESLEVKWVRFQTGISERVPLQSADAGCAHHHDEPDATTREA